MIAGVLEIQILAEIARLSESMRSAERVVNTSMTRIGASVERVDRAMQTMTGTVQTASRAFAGLIGFMGARELIGIADQYTKFTAQLKLAVGGATEYAFALSEVRRISKDSQSDISATGVLYARMTNSLKELGLGQGRVSQLTETVSLSLKASGATAQESASAMLQLSQAFASGMLRGEEFNAVNEAAPRLMKALADGIGVPVGALREMAKEGQITSAVMAEALPKALESLRQEAAQVQTISGAFTVLKNNVVEFVGTQAQASGAVNVLTTALTGVANNLNLITAAAVGYGAAKLAATILETANAARIGAAALVEQLAVTNLQRQATIAYAAGLVESTVAQVAHLKATEAGIVAARADSVAKLQAAQAALVQAQAQIQAATAAGALSFALAVKREGELAATAATAAHSAAVTQLAILGQQQARVSAQITAATAAQTAAQTALTAATTAGGAAAGLASRLLGFLGGPIGAVTALLGIGVTAWLAWGSASENAEQRAAGAVEKSTAEILEDLNKQIAKLRERNALAAAGMPDVAKQGGEGAAKLAQLQSQINDVQAGRGMGANLPDVARLDLLRKLTLQYGQLAGAVTTVREEQAKLDATGKAATDLIEVRQRLLGVNKQYLEDLTKLQAALKAGAITEGEYIKLVSQLATETYKKSDAGKAAADALKGGNKELDEQKKLIAELAGLTGSFAEDWDRLNRMYAKGVITLDQLTNAQAKLLKQQPFQKELTKEQEEATKRLTEALEEEAKVMAEIAELVNEDQKRRASGGDILRGIEEEIALMQMSNIEREKAIALRELENAGIKKGSEAYEELAPKIKAAVEQREGIREHIKMWESIDRTAHDVFTNIFNGGSNVFKKLGQTLKAALLDMLYKMTIRPWIIQIGAQLGIPGANIAAQAMGGGGGGSGFGGLSGVGELSGLGLSISNTIGTAYANATGTGIDGLLAANGAYGTAGAGTIGSALPYIGALFAASQGQYGQAAGMAIGTAIMPGIGTAIGAIIGSLVDGMGSKGGPKTESGFGIGVPTRGDPTASRAQVDAIKKMYSDLVSITGAVRRDLQLGIFSAQDPQGTAMTQLTVNAALDGQQFFGRSGENVQRGEEGLKTALTEAVNRLLLGALQRSDVPDMLGEWLRSLGDVALMSAKKVEEAITRLQRVGAEKKQLDETWFQLTSTAAEILARDRQREIESLDILNRAQAIRIHALQDEIAKQQQAKAIYAQASQEIEQLRLNIGAYVDRLNATPAGLLSPQAQLSNAQAQFAIQLASAKSGNRNALQNITGYADQLIQAQIGYSASGQSTQDTIAYVKQALTELPNLLSAEQIVATAIEDGSGLVNASIQELIARADANSAAQIAAINAELAATNATNAANAAALVALINSPKVQGLIEQTRFRGGRMLGMSFDEEATAGRASAFRERMAARTELRELGVPGYADGGYYGGGFVHMVGERGPELRASGPARYWSAEQTARMVGTGSQDVVQAIARLESRLDRLAVISATGHGRTVEGLGAVAANTADSAQATQKLASSQRERPVVA